MRVDRPIGTFLLLWPTLWALWFAAEGTPTIKNLLIFVTGVIVMRAAGCVINDYADRNIDPYVARTKHRPLAKQEIPTKNALILFAGLMLLAFVLVLFTNKTTIGLACVGGVLAASYPFAKRYIYFPQVYLGMAFAWSVPMAYTAQAGDISDLGWLLFVSTVIWTTAYDTVYAMVDREDDMKIGVRSTAILLGDLDRISIALLDFLFIFTLFLAGTRSGLGLWFITGLAVASGLLVYQLWLIKDQQPEACFKAFLLNNYVGAVIFIGLLADYQLR